MSESFNAEDLKKLLPYAKYVQKKERLISALNSAIRTAEAPIYAVALDELVVLLLEDKLLPDSFDTSKFLPELYPRPEKKEKKQSKPNAEDESYDDEGSSE